MKTAAQSSHFLKSCATALLSLAIAAGSSQAQVWEEWISFYNGSSGLSDQALAMAMDSAGNICVAGWSTGVDKDYATVKYTSEGDELWVARYEGEQADVALAIAVDAEGNIVVTGKSQNASLHDDCLTIKYNAEGIQQWAVRYNGATDGDDGARDIAIDSEGNCYIAGWSEGLNTNKNFLTIKYSASGTELWTRSYDGPSGADDEAWSIALDEVGHVYVSGSSTGLGSDFDYATIQYDSTGLQRWVARYNGPSNGTDWAYSLTVSEFGFACITGMSWGPGGNFDCATLQYDPDGVERWVTRFNGANNGTDKAYSIALDSNQNIYIAGYTSGNYLTIRYSTDGIQEWAAVYNGSANSWDEALALAVDAQGNATVTGRSQGVSTRDDLVTIRYDFSGAEQWVARYVGAGAEMDEARAVVVDGEGTAYVTGFAGVAPGLTDYCTIKYAQICPLSIALTPTSPPVQIPPLGGHFSYSVALMNEATSAQIFDVWIMTRLPNGIWHGPLFGPLALTLPGGGSLTRTRWQHVPASAPSGEYWYEGRVGDYPSAIWDTSRFAFAKLASGDWRPGSGDWSNTGEAFDSSDEPFITHHSSLITSIAPNPFNASSVIAYELPEASLVKLGIYDISGRLVATLVDGWRMTGQHEVTFDGSELPSGIYLARLTVGGFTVVQKMVMIK